MGTKMGAGWFVVALLAALFLSACGEKESVSTANETDLRKQAEEAQAKLQQKADAMARQASMSPPPPAEKKK